MRQLLFVMTMVVQAQAIKPDTQALAMSLRAIRGEPELTADKFRTIHKAFLEWVDVRLRYREPVGALNRELEAAGAFGSGSCADPSMCNFTGSLDEVSATSVTGADDLLAVHLAIGTTCGADQTIVLYQRRPWRRIGWLNHGDIENGMGYGFSSFKVGERDSEGRRLVASGEYSRWCTSTLIGVKLRIDIIEGASLHMLLNKKENARLDTGDPITAAIDGNRVTFRYIRDTPSGDWTLAIERYSVVGNKAIATPRSDKE